MGAGIRRSATWRTQLHGFGNDHGQDLVEYALMIGIVVFASVALMSTAGESIQKIWVPKLPWPPPVAAARDVLPHQLFAAKHFGDVDWMLRTALDANGYAERGYYAVPRGFALVTKLEQIERDGTPKQTDRWSVSAPRLTKFSLQDYITALFSAPSGHYRVIVFVVTDVPFAGSAEKLGDVEAMKWVSGGLNVLPESIAKSANTTSMDCTALIYEFERARNATNLLLASRIDGHTHLLKAGILDRLNKPRS
jgi:hypothetical protein